MFQKQVDNPQALGLQHQLGNHRATYKPPISHITVIMIGCILCLAFCILGLASSSCLLFFGPLILCSTVFWVYRKGGQSVFIYDYGLIYRRWNSLQPVPWQSVREVRHKVHFAEGGQTHTYTVNCTDDTSLTLDDEAFAKLQQLGKSIEEETARYLFPEALDTYQMNHSVTFGPFTVTSQGFYHGQNLLPWSEMKSIQITFNVRIRRQGKLFDWADVNLANVPNAEVFRMLVQHVRREQGFTP